MNSEHRSLEFSSFDVDVECLRLRRIGRSIWSSFRQVQRPSGLGACRQDAIASDLGADKTISVRELATTELQRKNPFLSPQPPQSPLYPPLRAPQSRESGSILILVLWVLFFLAALTVAIGTHVTTRMMAAERLWSRTVSRSLAEAGAQLALAEAVGHTNAWDGIMDSAWNRDEDLFTDREVGQAACTVFFYTVEQTDVVVTNAGIIGEEGKLNVNMVVRDETMGRALANLVATVGERNAEQAGQLVASIQDWVDDDDEMLTSGAESGYYSGLSSSYSCANGPMRSMAELRMVKGMDVELYARLVPYLTVYGSGNINLNCATEPVIVALALACAGEDADVDACESLARKIVEFQKGYGFRTDDDIKNPPEDLELTHIERTLYGYISPGNLGISSTAFRGISSGVDDDGEHLEMSVEFVCDANDGQFVYWREF